MIEDKITIVIPCKNEENYISFLLDDLKKQCLGRTRIIIADASTDNTRDVIMQNKGNLDIEIIEGGPVSIAKNNGAKLATTPYILFIDSDVRFFSDTVILESVYELESNNLDLVGLNLKCYDGDKRAQIGFMIFNGVNNIMRYKVPFAVGSFMLTRRDKFNQYGRFSETPGRLRASRTRLEKTILSWGPVRRQTSADGVRKSSRFIMGFPFRLRP